MSTKAIKAKSGPTLPGLANTRDDAMAVGEGLEAAIRCEHEAATSAARTALDHGLECGRLLAKAREGIAHGEWESFVRERCGIPERTARMYLRLDANRDRLPNRQHVAGLTVREAVRLLAEPKAKAEPDAGEKVRPLGTYWLKLTCVAAEFTNGWKLATSSVTPAAASHRIPGWYSPGYWHRGEHGSGWTFEVSPDSCDANRVNAIVHDPTGKVHYSCFEPMRPEGILPLMSACELHHSMPTQSGDWKVSSVCVAVAPDSLMPPFPYEVFRLAYGRHHTCYCWPLVDEAIGLVVGEGDSGYRAWLSFMRALAAIVNPGARARPSSR